MGTGFLDRADHARRRRPVKIDYREPVKILARRLGKSPGPLRRPPRPRRRPQAGPDRRPPGSITSCPRTSTPSARRNPGGRRRRPVGLGRGGPGASSLRPEGPRGGGRQAPGQRPGRDRQRLPDQRSRALSNDPTLLADEPRPVWIAIEGRLDPIKEAYLRRRIEQARRERVNLVFFKINSQGGLNTVGQQRGLA